jgi:putative transposase
MHWIKTHSAKRWNRIHGSTDHLWGERYFARPIKDPREYFYVMEYIDQNPVKAGLVQAVGYGKPRAHITSDIIFPGWLIIPV